ncbi:MAG: pH regulation protein F [Rhodospirillaceae bacterium]|nr:pH regulation protein F [Rhodospirillaceae bacterium]
MKFIIVAIAILVTMAMAIFRAAKGPTAFDRVLAANMFGTKTVLLIGVVGYIAGRPDFLDLALLYALLNFVGIIAMLRFIKIGHFGDGKPVDR